MAVFPSFNLTKKGEELLNRSIGEGRVLTFTKFKIGDGVPTGDWRDLDNLQSSFKEFSVLETAIQADQVLKIRGYFDNKGFATDKQFKEIGVFVTLDGVAGEHLYSYTNAGDTGNIIPAESRGFYSRTLDVNNYIGYATNITFNIEQTRDNFDFNTENELKVATFLKKGDKIRLWGRLVLGDIETLNYIVTDEITSFILDNALYCKLAGGNAISNTGTDLVNLKGARVGDVVKVLGYQVKTDGTHHYRVVEVTKKSYGVQLPNGLWANPIYDKNFSLYSIGVSKYIKKDLKPASYYGKIDFLQLLDERLFRRAEILRSPDGYKFNYRQTLLIGSSPFTVYIGNTLFTGLGNDIFAPISLTLFLNNYKNGLYDNVKNSMKVILTDPIINGYSYIDFVIGSAARIMIESMSPSGRTIITNGNTLLELEKVDTTQTGLKFNIQEGKVVGLVYDYTILDKYGMPMPYRQATSLADYNANNGVFYIDEGQQINSIFVKPYLNYTFAELGRKIIVTYQESIGVHFKLSGSSTLLLKNIDFINYGASAGVGSINLRGDSVYSSFILDSVRAVGGSADSFTFTKSYSAFLYNCVGAYASKDIFNYHTDNSESLAVEINCVGYGAGKYKVTKGNQGTNSNNATTCHDGMTVYRFGSEGFGCEGPVLADVGDCTSINYDCEMYESTTPNGTKSSYLITGNNSTPHSTAALINCKGGHIDNSYTIYTNRSVELIIDKFEGDLKNDKLFIIPENTYIMEDE